MIVCLILFVSWIFLKYADLPVEILTRPASALAASTDAAVLPAFAQAATPSQFTVECSLAVYGMAVLSLVGWVLLIFFGGIGLFALPMDMVLDFVNRPRLLTTAEGKRKKEELLRAT